MAAVRNVVLLLIVVTACVDHSAQLGPERRCSQQLHFAPEMSTTTVQLRGEWSGFAAEAMTNRDGVWSWEGTLTPRSQGYAYRFEVNGAQVLDPLNGFTRWVGQTESSRLFAPECTAPLLEVTRFNASNTGALSMTVLALRASTQKALSAPRVTLDGEALQAGFEPSTGVIAVERSGLMEGKHQVKVELVDESGAAAEPLFLPFWVEAKPFQWRDALMYFAFTDRFRDGAPASVEPIASVDARANYQGGDFVGLTQAIEEGYFDKLGVTAIWISPVDENPELGFGGTGNHLYTGYHGYWPSAPRTVEARLGSLETLRNLTQVAHAHGIRVLADLVFNHVHQDHPYFVDHQVDGWFNTGNGCVCGTNNCSYDDKPLVCWFTPYLPDFNWRSTALADRLTADAMWWVEQADFDGFRVDAVKHFDQTAVRSLRASLAKITNITGVPFYLVGETFTGSDGRAQLKSFIGPQLLDGQFDFPLYWPVVDGFAKGQSLRMVEAAARLNETSYSSQTLNSPFLGNHDVARFASIAAGQIGDDPGGQAWSDQRPPASIDDALALRRLKWAFTFVLSQPGVPLIYYGDELGMPGAGDPDNRRMMKWSNLTPAEADMLSFMRKLGIARATHAALRTGARDTLFVDDDALVLQKSVEEEVVLVAINRADTARTLEVTLRRQSAGASHAFVDVFTGARFEVGSTLTVPATTSLVLVEPR